MALARFVMELEFDDAYTDPQIIALAADELCRRLRDGTLTPEITRGGTEEGRDIEAEMGGRHENLGAIDGVGWGALDDLG